MSFQSNMPHLHVQKLCVNRGSLRVIDDLGFACHAGEIVWLRGGNGSGKTTLLRTLAGFLPYDGEIIWKNSDVQTDLPYFQSQIAWCDDVNGVRSGLTVFENAISLAGHADSAAIQDALQYFNLNHKQDIPVQYLSAGQIKRLALAVMSLRADKDLWLLDEPFVNLDDDAVEKLQLMISMRQLSGKITLFSSHQNHQLKSSQVLQMGAA